MSDQWLNEQIAKVDEQYAEIPDYLGGGKQTAHPSGEEEARAWLEKDDEFAQFSPQDQDYIARKCAAYAAHRDQLREQQ